MKVKSDHRSEFITLHFHPQPRCKYGLFHINFTSFHCTGRYELNKLTSLPMCSFIAQLVEHRTGIAEVTGSNPVEALIFFRLLLSNCLNWKFTAMITLHFKSFLILISRNRVWPGNYLYHHIHFLPSKHK